MGRPILHWNHIGTKFILSVSLSACCTVNRKPSVFLWVPSDFSEFSSKLVFRRRKYCIFPPGNTYILNIFLFAGSVLDSYRQHTQTHTPQYSKFIKIILDFLYFRKRVQILTLICQLLLKSRKVAANICFCRDSELLLYMVSRRTGRRIPSLKTNRDFVVLSIKKVIGSKCSLTFGMPSFCWQVLHAC